MDIKLLYSMCKEKEWIFSDFFETLVHRKLSEDTVCQIWAKKVSEKIGYVVTAKEIYLQRNVAAKNIFKTLKEREEITYCEIIKEVYSNLHQKLTDCTLSEFQSICYNVEIQTEVDFLYLDKELYEFLLKLKDEGKKIALVSDYSLPDTAVFYIMQKLNIESIFDLVFVSSMYDKRKRTGHLYTEVIQKTGCKNNAIMIGDNKKSDYNMAIKSGLSAYYLTDGKNSTLPIKLKENLNAVAQKYKDVAFSKYSFELFMFIERLYMKLIEQKIDSVCFMAREGFVLKKLFDVYQYGRDHQIASRYLYVSRKATLLPSIYRDGDYDFNSLFLTYNKLDVQLFLRNLSFTESEIGRVLAEFPYEKNNMISDFKNSKEFRWLLNSSSVFHKILREKCKKANMLFRKYILCMMSSGSKELALVDVGWKGTIQDNIYFSLGDGYTVRGYYLGLDTKTGQESNRNIKEGILFSILPRYSKLYSLLNFEKHLLEQLLAAPHGSTAGYEELDGEVKEILEEYSGNDRELFEATKNIQDAIFAAFKDIKECFDYTVENTYTAENIILKLCIKGALLLNKKSIVYEKTALNSKTNNFGWFSKSPVSISKKQKIHFLLKDLKNIHKSGLGMMRYLNYFAVKMNARKKYEWKILVYRIVFYIQNLKLR